MTYTIDEDLRILDSDKECPIGVTGDKEVNVITFKMPRIYNDNDLSTFTIRVIWETVEGARGYTKVEESSKRTESDNDIEYLYFDWVTANLFETAGTIRFAVNLYTTEESTGLITKSFNTDIAKLEVLEGLSCDSTLASIDRYDVKAEITSDVVKSVDEYLDSKTEAMNELLSKFSVSSNLAVYQTISNRGLTAESNSYDTGSKNSLIKYTVTAGDTLYLNLAEPTASATRTVATYTFQNTYTIALSGGASRLVGEAGTGAINGYITVPEGAVCLIISVASTTTTNKVQSVYYNIDSDTTLSKEGAFADSKVTGDRISALETEPTVGLSIDHDIHDVSTQRALVDYDNTATKVFKTKELAEDGSIKEFYIQGIPNNYIHEQVQGLFDQLCADYPDYVTRVDAAEEAGLTYPDYVSSVTVSRADAEAGPFTDTTGYKHYMYKFTTFNKNIGHDNKLPKKKMFIVSGLHGKEKFAPLNAYLFAEQLCKCEDANFFKLRSAFDVYVIPCVNGYGLHQADKRTNGNSVDINRNFPVEKWSESETGAYYSGSSAGSEFETQMIVNITKSLNPDLCIDHHNYFGDITKQFMVSVPQDSQLPMTYQSLIDCSYAFVQNYPEYYGTSYHVFIETQNLDGDTVSNDYAPYKSASADRGTAVRWWYEAGVKMSTTIEVCNQIKYQNGQLLPDEGFHKNDADCLAVAEYTFRNLILHFAQYVLGGSVTNSTSYSDGSGVSY
jgi:hypothetical protein